MGFTTAKPKPILFIQVTDISHAMPNDISILNLVNRILVASRYILARDDRSSDHQFANRTNRQNFRLPQLRDRIV